MFYTEETELKNLQKMPGMGPSVIRLVGGHCNKIPARLQRPTEFFVFRPPPRKRASACKQKIPPSLRSGGDFVEVGGVSQKGYFL